MNASSFVKEMNSDSIKVYEVKESEITEIDRIIPTLKPIPGTMKIHQVFTTELSKLEYRDISCLSRDCTDHLCRTFAFPNDNIIGDKENFWNDDEEDSVVNTDDIVHDDNQNEIEINGIDYQLRNCRNFEDIQNVLAGSGRETLVVENMPDDLSALYQLEVRLPNKTNENRNYYNDKDDNLETESIDHQMQAINACQSYPELEVLYSKLPTAILEGKDRYIIGGFLTVCEASIDLYPDDVPHETNFTLLKFELMGIVCQHVVVYLCMAVTIPLMKLD